VRVIIFGATGMIGSGVLLECMRDPQVTAVLSVVRSASGKPHRKLTELVHRDFHDYDGIITELEGCDACFFCLGVTSAGMSEAEYHGITVDLTLEAARALVAVNPGLVFCYVSGAGTDSSERGRQMWARVKGKVENRLLAMPFNAHMFRPGYVQPVRGVHSKTRWYRVVYGLIGPLYPVLKRLFPRHVMTSEDLGRAMIRVAREGAAKRILEAPDIIALAVGETRAGQVE
jgi:nucleoside-diphosphate-sugar epimerase